METLKNHRISETQSHNISFFAFRFSLLFISLILLFSPRLTAQNYTALREAFSKSYEFEAKGNYTEAISALKTVYQEDSYETNLRLGWLTYLAGLFTESGLSTRLPH